MNFDAIMKDLQNTVLSSNTFFFQNGHESEFECFLANAILRSGVPNVSRQSRKFSIEYALEKHGAKQTDEVKPDIVANKTIFELSYRPASAVICDRSLSKGKTEDSVITGPYKVWYDVWKIEQIVNSNKSFDSGYAIILTNNAKYWDAEKSADPEDYYLREFSLHNNRPPVSGTMKVHWDGKGRKGRAPRTTLPKGRPIAVHERGHEGKGKLSLCGNYKIDWKDWNGFPKDKTKENGYFRYLALHYKKKK